MGLPEIAKAGFKLTELGRFPDKFRPPPGGAKAHGSFQVVLDLPFQEVDGFTATHPGVVPALTLLSQRR